MQFKLPKNNDRYQWTLHSIEKMKFYGLSEQKVLGIVKRPKRKEEGIVKNTIAVMQPVSVKMDAKGKMSWKTEIWAMYQTKKEKKSKVKIANEIQNLHFHNLQKILNPSKIKIISAWRYPGVSPEHNPIPEEILREIVESNRE
ncbi:MAG: hypothetical protein Q7T51_00775 [Candidatus Moranbacteria bacterium]|nr:hypothetical protein [Candidatus Moranbacteria bacterium]